MSDVPLSLQAIKAKLQELQQRQQSVNISSCTTPSSTQTLPSGSIRTLEFTGDRYMAGAGLQQGTDGHHLSCKENVDPRKDRVAVETCPNPCVVTSSCKNGALVNRLLNAPSLENQQCILKPRNAPLAAMRNATCELTDWGFSGNQPECKSDNALYSEVVTDHEAHMRQIERGGNAPEEWLEYIRNIPAEGDVKPEAFSRAFSGILKGRNHKDESVHLVMDYVQFCSERFEWDSVSTILDLARAVIQNYAVITIASAEVKILKGDQEKAMSILSKALAKGKAQPKELLVRALKAAEAGQTKLLSEQERRLEDTWVLGKKRCSQDTATEELKMPPTTSTGFTDTQMDNVTEPFSRGPKSSVTAEQCPVFTTHPSSASKQSFLRHYSSTPEMRSMEMKQWSHVKKSPVRLNLGMPRRVRSTLQQHPVSVFSEEKEDDTDLTDSVKPFNPVPRGRLLSSGYHTEDSKSSDHFSSEMPHKKSPVKQEAIDHGTLSQHIKTSGRPPSQLSQSQPAASLAPEAPGDVKSTPFKGPAPLQPTATMQTPSGAMMETVTVNGDPYFILKKVGRGGSAQVYMVLDNNKNIRALKVVDLEGVGLEVVDGYRNEISVLQRLQYCSCVIKMFSFELNEKLNRLYVVLEFGETDLSGFFATRAKQNEGLNSTLIKFYWEEMLRAVNALHKEGIIHSDLKPANFMLVAANLKLIDFGIANSLQQDKTSVLKDSRVGTPGYMSPEAIMAACDEAEDAEEDNEAASAKSPHRPKYKVGMRSDVWSLGCILYNMVYGRTPFQHIKNNLMKLRAITDPSYAIQFPPISDPLLLDVLQRCLTRDIKLRPTTDELLAHPYLHDKNERSN